VRAASKNNPLADDNNGVPKVTTGRHHRRRTCSGAIFLLGLLIPATSLLAQRTFELDAAMHQTNLGAGLSPVLTEDRQMQLSDDASTLYLGKPHTRNLGKHGHREPPAHHDELIYSRRMPRKSAGGGNEYPHYPLFHANKTGKPIAEISDEDFTIKGDNDAPILHAYLRKISATITVDGKKLP